MAETVGWLADKISIMELKIYHMREQSERRDATPEFRARCVERVAVLARLGDDAWARLARLGRRGAGLGRAGGGAAVVDPAGVAGDTVAVAAVGGG